VSCKVYALAVVVVDTTDKLVVEEDARTLVLDASKKERDGERRWSEEVEELIFSAVNAVSAQKRQLY